jgi:hypothetical protein
MRSKTLGASKLSLLMACASPGSALAYHLGLASNQAGLMQRSTGATGQPATAGAGPAEPVRSVVSWLTGLPAAAARWYAERERKELDRYLAQAQNVSDLEARMRDLHSGRYWLP